MSINSDNTKVLETYDDHGNMRMLLFRELESGRREFIIGSYFTESHEYMPPNPFNKEGVIVDRNGECFDAASGHALGKATNPLSWSDPEYYAAVLEDDKRKGRRVHYSWDWGHYFSNVVNAAKYWRYSVLGVEDYEVL